MTQRRSRFDTRWTLAFLYATYVTVSLPMHLTVWTAMASGTGAPFLHVWPAVVGLFVSTIAVPALASCIAPATTESFAAGLSRWTHSNAVGVAALLLVLAVAAPLAIAFFVLERFPNSGDEFAYLFQGTLFAKGHLWAPAPPLDNAFVPYRTWVNGGKWLSQYPPGWPLALAGAMLARLPTWALNGLLGAATVAALMSPLWQFRSRTLALAASGVYVLTPFYLLNAASFHSHIVTALLVLLLCLCCLWYQRDRRTLALLAAGALLGLIGMTRYYALILVLPAMCYWVFVEHRGSRGRMILTLVLAGLPFLCLLMLYHDLVTGSPFRTTYALMTVKDAAISFTPANILKGISLTIYRLLELDVWASPVVVVTYLLCVVIKVRNRSVVFYDLLFPAFVAGYVFFADLGGNRYGPRYYFEGFPLMLATIASSAPQAAALARRLLDRPLAFHGLVACAIYLLTAWPFAFAAYHELVASRQEHYRLAAASGLSNAIVIVRRSSIDDGMISEDFARNDAFLDAPVLFARANTDPGALHRLFPHRSVWVYQSGERGQPGTLVRLLPSNASGNR